MLQPHLLSFAAFVGLKGVLTFLLFEVVACQAYGTVVSSTVRAFTAEQERASNRTI